MTGRLRPEKSGGRGFEEGRRRNLPPLFLKFPPSAPFVINRISLIYGEVGKIHSE